MEFTSQTGEQGVDSSSPVIGAAEVPERNIEKGSRDYSDCTCRYTKDQSLHKTAVWLAKTPQRCAGTVMVQCGEQNLLVRVQMDLFGTRHLIKAADLTLGTAGCRPTRIYSQNHTVLFDYGLHECGSRLQMAGDFLVYTTHLNHTPQYHGSVIVRTNGAVVPIECHYFRKGNVSSNPIKPTWIPFSSTKSGEGHLSFSLRLMNDDWLTERTSTVYYLGDLIHIEASVSMTNHMPLKLYIDRCVATLSPDKDSTPRYSIIDYNGCLLDSKAEDSFSTFVLPRDERELDKLQFDLDAFRFFAGDRSLIFITCHLKVAPVDRRDSMNKACTFHKMQNVWTPLEESNNDICACCHVGNCGATREFRFPSRGWRDLVPEAESEAGLKWEGEASLGPLVILDTEVTDLATASLNEVERRLKRSPGAPSGCKTELSEAARGKITKFSESMHIKTSLLDQSSARLSQISFCDLVSNFCLLLGMFVIKSYVNTTFKVGAHHAFTRVGNTCLVQPYMGGSAHPKNWCWTRLNSVQDLTNTAAVPDSPRSGFYQVVEFASAFSSLLSSLSHGQRPVNRLRNKSGRGILLCANYLPRFLHYSRDYTSKRKYFIGCKVRKGVLEA
ncbi:zona pellucida sperm-binding protein 3-like [Heterodontus francisci]|uniref:zona pellucida sperm-binding protein 3-like n=1 Tax=Heterodontus francisci TaxID=7792 RepID=UPI00355C8BF3